MRSAMEGALTVIGIILMTVLVMPPILWVARLWLEYWLR